VKKRRLISLLMAGVCMFLLVIPAFATAKASNQIYMYDIAVTPVSGTLNIKFSINAKAKMNEIGCESIYIYKKSGSSWVLVDSLDENDSGMSRSDTYSHKNTIYYDSESGVEYKVVVTVFAEDDSARDSRSRTSYVTGR